MDQPVRIGFIGMGSIGKPMALNLCRSGLPLTVWARRPEVLDDLPSSGQRAQTPAELGRNSDLVSIVVFDDAAVEEVMFGAQGLVEGLVPGSIVLVHSTVPPDFIVDVAERAHAYGIKVIDAPVSGGPNGAELGELTIMAGGGAEDLAQAKPLTDVLSTSVIHLGDIGAGQKTKLMNNAVFTAQLAIVESVVQLASELAIDPQALMRAISASSGKSFAVDMFRGAGSVEVIASGAAKPALTKDVSILRALVESDSLVLQAAEQFVKSMETASK